ncbi:DUF2752 domain-containing protein [Mollicutes bacterium LVI A0039]|nr:DUF2752 domain-containing protein [Mollicutes bacterium LVI A0039]
MIIRLKCYRNVFIIGFVVIAIYSFSVIIGRPIGCIIERLTGIECLSCGMTSAWYHALQGDFSTAFYFHPLFPLPAIIAILLFIDNIVLSKNSKVIKYIYIISLILVVAVYILRITGILDGFVPLDIRPWFI